jgi:hypothetical protein
MQQQAPLKRALENGAHFLSHATARKISQGHDNLKTG